MNISAALLVVWYCLSIIGFDVHTCMSSGEVFIATFADGVGCGDIHPEHHCCGTSCCQETHHHDHETSSCCSSEHHSEPAGHRDFQAVDTKSCCTNDYQMIALSGCRIGNDSDEGFHFAKLLLPYVAYIPDFNIASAKYHAWHISFFDPESGVTPPGDICATFGVWRI